MVLFLGFIDLIKQKSKKMNQEIKNQKHIDGPMNIPITQTGKRIQNYVFNYSDFLGAGNFSKCYKGYNQITSQVVAIKIVQLNSLKSKKLQQLLFQQIQILKKLNHPSVLKCYQIFTSNRNCYIITELCNQGNLQNRLKLKKVFDQTQANPIIKDVYDGLVYLGQNNIVHRDLKSANIFLHNGRAKIADFGFAKEIKHNFKDLNIGSPLYMAPQGILHNIYGPKTQVWAIGILVYQLFHGASPYIHCKTQQQLKQQVMIPLNWKQLRKDLSQDIKQFILTCLQINQQTRATIQQLGNLGYLRRLAQGPMGYQGFEMRSPSKSVNLVGSYNQEGGNGEVEKQQQQQQRVNNNFRAQNGNKNSNNNPFSRDVSRSNNNQRQQVIFRSVDMRQMNNNNSRNQDSYHSPHKRPGLANINHGPSSKFQINSPGIKRSQMISSLRPLSSQNQPIYINNNQQQQNVGGFHTQQQFQIPFSNNQNYQYRVYQAPQQNVIMMPNPQMNMINKSGEVILHDGFGSKQQVQNRPLSSYNQQQQQQQIPLSFDSLGYDSMNGFFNSNQFNQPNENINLTQTQSQSQQLAFNSSHQRTNTSSFNNQNNQVSDSAQNQSYMFKTKINFKQAIFFIHHCRLVFKFLYLFKELPCFDQQSYLKIFKYLMSVLTELNRLAQNNGVIADGQKAGLKVKKFRQVNLQYLAKYQKQLSQNNYTVHPQPITNQSFAVINSTLRQVLYKINQQITLNSRKQYLSLGDQNTIVLGHLCVVIIGSFKQIQQGIEARSYKKLLQFKLIETILNTPKEQFTMASYKSYKEKFIK